MSSTWTAVDVILLLAVHSKQSGNNCIWVINISLITQACLASFNHQSVFIPFGKVPLKSPWQQLACNGFAISLQRISRHFQLGESLRLAGHFWVLLKPGAGFLIAILSPINQLMPGRCPEGHRTHQAVPGQILDNPDTPYIGQTPPRLHVRISRHPAYGMYFSLTSTRRPMPRNRTRRPAAT